MNLCSHNFYKIGSLHRHYAKPYFAEIMLFSPISLIFIRFSNLDLRLYVIEV